MIKAIGSIRLNALPSTCATKIFLNHCAQYLSFEKKSRYHLSRFQLIEYDRAGSITDSTSTYQSKIHENKKMALSALLR